MQAQSTTRQGLNNKDDGIGQNYANKYEVNYIAQYHWLDDHKCCAPMYWIQQIRIV